MKDAMRFVFRKEKEDWKQVHEGQSFNDACNKARELETKTGIPHCVNKKG
jgi:hypothetical protein